MKLRVRYVKKTKVVEIADDPSLTLGALKLFVKESTFVDFGLDTDDFVVSLDGKTSAGDDEALLKDCGIVSGDLLKILLGDHPNAPPSSQKTPEDVPSSSSTSHNIPKSSSATHAASEMSISNEEPAVAGAGSSDEVVDIPWTSPGPILFQDCATSSEVPHLLQQLYEDGAVKTEFQALCLALHFMMCESGFFIDGQREHKDILKFLDSRMFSVEYSHPAGENLKFNFTCNQLGSFILMNGVVQPCQNTSEQVLTLQIPTNDYVASFTTSQKNNNASATYKNLAKLARRVKDTIAYPALNNMREELQLPPVHGLLSLFPELLMRIFSHLDSKSLVLASLSCKRVQGIACDDSLWRSLYIRDFRGHPPSVDTSWKEMYAKRFVQEKARREEMERRYRDYQTEPWPQFPTPGFGLVPLPDQPFGIYGGDHDLHPSFPYGPFANQPRNPRHFPRPNPMNPDNPLPGSRFDPIYPGGGYRPGRGGGLMDSDYDGLGGPPSLFNRRHGPGGGGGRHGGFRFF